MGFTTDTANKILDKILRGESFTPATDLYMSLHTADPGENGDNEITGYTRQVVQFGEASNKQSESETVLEFEDMPGVTVTHAGLWSAEESGDFWWGGELTNAPLEVTAGDTVRVNAGELEVELDA